MDYEALLTRHLPLVGRVIRFVAARHHLSDVDRDEFASLVHFKLVDRDFAVLRKFQGRSNLATYLTTVVERVYLDYRIARWGKWRPSTGARRLGPVAILLEEMLVRDGLSFDEAVGTLQTNHGVAATREELFDLAQRLPERTRRRVGGEGDLAAAARRGRRDPAFDRAEEQQIAGRVETALAQAIERLDKADQLALKLRYLDDLPVAAMARVLQVDPRGLYKRFGLIFALLRDDLRREGIEPADIDRIVGHPAVTLNRILQSLLRNGGDRSNVSV